MTLKYLLFLPSLFVALNVTSQSSSIVDIDALVTQIRTELDAYQKIEQIKTDSSSKDIYLKKEEVIMITVTEKGKIEKRVEWYYQNGVLIYTETNWTTINTNEKIHHEKTYHHKGVMIAWLENERNFVDANSSKFKTLEKSLNAYAAKIRIQALE